MFDVIKEEAKKAFYEDLKLTISVDIEKTIQEMLSYVPEGHKDPLFTYVNWSIVDLEKGEISFEFDISSEYSGTKSKNFIMEAYNRGGLIQDKTGAFVPIDPNQMGIFRVVGNVNDK